MAAVRNLYKIMSWKRKNSSSQDFTLTGNLAALLTLPRLSETMEEHINPGGGSSGRFGTQTSVSGKGFALTNGSRRGSKRQI